MPGGAPLNCLGVGKEGGVSGRGFKSEGEGDLSSSLYGSAMYRPFFVRLLMLNARVSTVGGRRG